MTRRAAWLAAVVAADIIFLVALRIAGVGGWLEIVAQIALIGAFVALAVTDLRAAVAIVVLELALGGASGRWTVFGGTLSGRIVLDAVVFGVSLWRLARATEFSLRDRLGRYGPHALAVAIVLPGIWIPLGIVNGWRPADAWGDGNGYLFFAFALVLAALALHTQLGWLRRWLLVACTATAALTATLAVIAVFVIPDFIGGRDVLLRTLEQGGAISLTDDYLRLALGSGIYLVVGLALLTWEIVSDPRRAWPWTLVVVFAVALLASYTRAFWLAGAGVVLLVAIIGTHRFRGLVLATAIAVVAFVSAGAFSISAGWPYPAYLYERVSTVIAVPDEDADLYELEFGVVSNAMKLHQARVLLGHISERPIHGWGFGAIAPDYRYGQIYSYELSYLALAYKAGLLGVLLFFSLPVRLLWDAVRMRLGRLVLPPGVARREAAVPIAVIGGLLAIGATNPYLVASFGLAPIVLMICWLDPLSISGRPAGPEDRR